MKFTRTIKERLFIVEAKEAYQKEAEDLLTIVEDYFEENLEELNQLIPIHYGNIKVVSIKNEYHVCVPNYEQKQLEELNQLIPIHYGNIKVVSIENEYHVCVPNYEQKQLEEWITDCSYFLEIVQKTFKAGKRTKTLGKLVPFRFDSPVIIANHTFEVEDFYAHRFDDETWYIAPVDQEIESQPLSGAKAYEIFPDYPSFYDMMHLPTDTIVIFHKGEIVSVLELIGGSYDD